MAEAALGYYSVFGNTKLLKGFCSGCCRQSIVIDGKLACCDKPFNATPALCKRESISDQRRKMPTKREQRRILQAQDFRCWYCERNFGDNVNRKSKAIGLVVQFDHVQPFSFSQNNKTDNFVASCQICNGIKSDLSFGNLEEAKSYIRKVIKRKGYEYEENPMPALLARNRTEADNKKVLLKRLPHESQHSLGYSKQDETPCNSKTGCGVSTSQSNNCAENDSSKTHKVGNVAGKDSCVQDGIRKNNKMTPIRHADETLREWLADYVSANTDVSKTELQKRIGCSRTAIDNYLAGTYFLPKEQGGQGVVNSKIEDKIKAFKATLETLKQNDSIIKVLSDGCFRFQDADGNTIAVIEFQDNKIASVIR